MVNSSDVMPDDWLRQAEVAKERLRKLVETYGPSALTPGIVELIKIEDPAPLVDSPSETSNVTYVDFTQKKEK